MNLPANVVIVNFLAFQLLWPAAVLGASLGWAMLAWCVLLAMLITQVALTGRWRNDGVLVVAGAALCVVMEPLWLLTDVLEYRNWPHRWWAPHWVWALWMGFAVSFRYSLGWLCGRPVLAALFGAVGGVFSVTMGMRFGAASAPQGWVLLAVIYAIGWAIAVPILAQVATMTMRGKENA
ncbi:DUF2878 domain-containing protein [Alcanivorax borkumensis]|uniref:DUF2878 domain-containing protein n=1 Tax=Alcanivorax borkumensis TaxID=59754 RepID=UPI0035694BC6